jgi:predicted DNA binding CopG/RHH family protein
MAVENKDVRVMVRLTDSEYKRACKMAKEAGLRISAYIRKCVEDALSDAE